MTSPSQTEPPFVPLRHKGWASKRTPLWVFAVVVVLAVGTVVLSLNHQPSSSQRASDLRTYFGDVTTGIGSCAAGVRGSETAYDQVLRGDTAQAKTAVSIFNYGGSNCTVAGSEPVNDFANYQGGESLDSLNLDTADNHIITWGFGAHPVHTDIGAIWTPRRRPRARAPRLPTCRPGRRRLHEQRAASQTAGGLATGAPEL